MLPAQDILKYLCLEHPEYLSICIRLTSNTHTHTPDGFLCMLFPCFKRTLHLHWKLVLCVCPGREDILFLLSAVQFSVPCPHCLSCPYNALPLCVYRGLTGSSSPRWNTGIILSMEPVGAVLSCSAGSLCILQETDLKSFLPGQLGWRICLGIKQMPLKTMHFLLKSSCHNNCTALLLSNKALFFVY